MTVKSIADQAGYSASRFSRGFTRLQGESVMSYVRGRRLEAAMGRLLEEPNLRIVDLAFDSGFDSQEAFTRAFVRAFGHPPGRLRSLGPRAAGDAAQEVAARREIHERTEQVPELHLAGLVRRLSPANAHELPQTWQRLQSLRGFPGELDASTYAVMLKFDPPTSTSDLFSGLRVSANAQPPPELERRSLPAATCRHVRLARRLRRLVAGGSQGRADHRLAAGVHAGAAATRRHDDAADSRHARPAAV